MFQPLGLRTVYAALTKQVSAAFGWKGLVALADLIADQCAGSSTANSSKRAAKDSIARHAAKHCASARTDLRIGRIGSAAGQGNQGSGSS